MEALTETLINLGSRVHKAEEQGSPVEELGGLLPNMGSTPGEPANAAAIQAAQFWATAEDQDDIVEAMREDAVEEMTAQLIGTSVDGGDVPEQEEEAGGDESTGRAGGGAPPAHPELPSHFGVLETAAGESGNGEAVSYLTKARMAMVAVHASNRTREADLRKFIEKGGGGRNGRVHY